MEIARGYRGVQLEYAGLYEVSDRNCIEGVVVERKVATITDEAYVEQ